MPLRRILISFSDPIHMRSHLLLGLLISYNFEDCYLQGGFMLVMLIYDYYEVSSYLIYSSALFQMSLK